MPFQFQRLEIPDVILITPKVFGDPRGFFMETFKQSQIFQIRIPPFYLTYLKFYKLMAIPF